MPKPRSRFSRRHLLALCTFLVPLGVLAVLGQSELQREGSQTKLAIANEAKQFLHGATQAVNEQFDRQMLAIQKTEELLAEKGPARTAVTLREEGYAALLDIVLLNGQGELVWPRPPRGNLGLPFSRDPADSDEAIAGALQCADFLLSTGDTEQAVSLLQYLVTLIEQADQPNLQGYETVARLRLATAHHKLGKLDAAHEGFVFVRDAIYPPVPPSGRRVPLSGETAALGLLAETKLAEMGNVDERVKLLRTIAESRRDEVADGLLTAIAERISAGIAQDDGQRHVADGLLKEERQRAQTRGFAPDYNFQLLLELRKTMRTRRSPRTEPVAELPADVQIVSTLPGGATSLLWVRAATQPERDRRNCERVGLHFDLGQLLAPALQPFFGGDGTFVLAIDDPEGKTMVAAPTAVPEDYVAPEVDVHGVTLRAFPANAELKIAQTAAALRNRTILMLALFATALGGALWLWRSVSREAELAALKVDLVSRVSHELKTPLALIRMYGETLGMGRARDAGQACHFGGIIARESERLTTLIQRILDFSRQQAGTLSYSPELVDLGGLMRKVCEAYTPHLEARGAILVESLPGDIFARCDASACESAIVNLLENAAKYAIEGDDEHEIELDLATRDGQAVIEVRDRGRGIPEAECNRVFDGFYRASNSGEVRGAGLGLSLVRHFARAHGGDVSVASREGGGSVFRLTLPLAVDAAGAPIATPAQAGSLPHRPPPSPSPSRP